MSSEEKVENIDEQDKSAEAGDTQQAGDDPAEQAPSHAELTALLEDARNKADEHWNRCLRAEAELDNLRKRNAREIENAHKYALEKFVTELLPVRDSMELGLAAAQQEDIDPAKLREGIDLTLKMLATVMDKFHITQIDPQGEKFDPERHQAMSMQETADAEPNTVLEVVQKGYLLNDRLIRPAMVVVAKAPAE